MAKYYLRNRLCIPFRGVNRAIIYDLTRKDYFFIPVPLYHLIKTDSIIQFEPSIEDRSSSDWEKFLLEHEIIFQVMHPEEKKSFPEISYKYSSPDILTNVVIHDDVPIDFLNNLIPFYLWNITVLVDIYNPSKLNCLLSRLRGLEVDSFSFYIKEQNQTLTKEDFDQINIPGQIMDFYTFNNPTYEKEKILQNSGSSTLIKLPYTYEDYTSRMLPSKLQINNLYFFEAYNHHTYFNQKLYIDNSGWIRNGLNSERQFGNIEALNAGQLMEIVKSDSFKKLWNVRKNDTLVCKDCEFRYMCVDPREPKLSEKGDWYHDQECSYNPYISKWNDDENFKSLKESGISIDEKGKLTIDKNALGEAFEAAWNNQ